MKLRFEVDQAYCFRHGIDAPTSVVVIEKDPNSLPQFDRDLIADRLHGIRVCPKNDPSRLIMSKTPDYEGLIDAILADVNSPAP